MDVIFFMLGVTACYTITSLSDRYAAHDVKFTGSEFTCLMCSSMSVFVACFLPFQERYLTLSWQSLAAVLLTALCKVLEFEMSMLVMKQIPAFELKAWLGINLFVSYVTELAGGADLNFIKLVCIGMTAVGLVLIVRSEKAEKTDYLKVGVPLILYLFSKYGYSIVIKTFTPFIAPTYQLLFAMIIITLATLFRVKPIEIFRKSKKGALTVILARIPNAAGTLLENAVIAISITCYSFIQPMILVTLFIIDIIKNHKRRRDRRELVGSAVCIAGILLFVFI